jgi:NADH:ubiquinone oxidoreductase subunit E/NAD-dependent dihydropyrimidine dehydrogenase PreA subunit
VALSNNKVLRVMKRTDDDRKVGAVLVAGGGIAGVQASLDLAESGYYVYLVENSPAIGGVMAQLDKTFPTNDCSMCILSPKLVECGRHLNIELLTYSDVEKLEGEAGNFTATIHRRARFIDESKCVGCGRCIEHCMTRNEIRLPEVVEPSRSTLEVDGGVVDSIIDRHDASASALIAILQEINEEFGYLPQRVLRYVSFRLGIPLSRTYHVATFYTAFSLVPRGRHTIKVCMGTACKVNGAGMLLEQIQRELQVEPGRTTEDQRFSLEVVRCLGCCSLSPVVVVDNDTYAYANIDKIGRMLDRYE